MRRYVIAAGVCGTVLGFVLGLIAAMAIHDPGTCKANMGRLAAEVRVVEAERDEALFDAKVAQTLFTAAQGTIDGQAAYIKILRTP